MELKQLFTFAAACSLALSVSAQDRVHYTGTELSNPTYHDGQLSPVVGVHNIQVMRANREHPAPDNGNGWTYNHQSMLAYWNGQFYMHYLSDPSDEHIPPSQTFLMTSKDGYHWTNPVTSFSYLPGSRWLYQARTHRQGERSGCHHASACRLLCIKKR